MSADKLHPCTLYQHIVELKHEIGRRSTNQPINRAPNEPARPTFVQICLFGVKNGHFSTYQKTTYAPCSHCFLVVFGNKSTPKMFLFLGYRWIFGVRAHFSKLKRSVESTLSFGLRSTSLSSDLHFPKLSTVMEDYWVPAKIDGETHSIWIILTHSSTSLLRVTMAMSSFRPTPIFLKPSWIWKTKQRNGNILIRDSHITFTPAIFADFPGFSGFVKSTCPIRTSTL